TGRRIRGARAVGALGSRCRGAGTRFPAGTGPATGQSGGRPTGGAVSALVRAFVGGSALLRDRRAAARDRAGRSRRVRRGRRGRRGRCRAVPLRGAGGGGARPSAVATRADLPGAVLPRAVLPRAVAGGAVGAAPVGSRGAVVGDRAEQRCAGHLVLRRRVP